MTYVSTYESTQKAIKSVNLGIIRQIFQVENDPKLFILAKYCKQTQLLYFLGPQFHIFWEKMLIGICINLQKYPKGDKKCQIVDNNANIP